MLDESDETAGLFLGVSYPYGRMHDLSLLEINKQDGYGWGRHACWPCLSHGTAVSERLVGRAKEG